MRALTQLLNFLVLEINPVLDEVFGEDATGQEVVLVGIKRFQRPI